MRITRATLLLLVLGAGAPARGQFHLRGMPVPIDAPGFVRAYLEDVHLVASNDAWAVGTVMVPNSSRQRDELTYILRWNGARWSRIPSPSPQISSSSSGRNCLLHAVAATSASDAWAAGSYKMKLPGSGFVGHQTLFLHWDGRQWRHVPPFLGKFGSSQQGNTGSTIRSIEAIAKNDVWFFGFWSGDQLTDSKGPMALHYNGSRIDYVKTPRTRSTAIYEILDTSALAANDIWAVGYSGRIFAKGQETYVIRWDGRSWNRLLPPANVRSRYRLRSVLARRKNDVWIAGIEEDLGQRTVASYVVHFDGAAWTRYKAPGFLENLTDVGGETWAFSDRVYRFDGKAWNIVTGLGDRSRAHLCGAAARGRNDILAVGSEGSPGTRLALAVQIEASSRGIAKPRYPCSGLKLRHSLRAATAPRIATSFVVGLDHQEAGFTIAAPTGAYWLFALRPLPGNCGVRLPGFGLGATGAELLIDPSGFLGILGPSQRQARGKPAYLSLSLPKLPRLVGAKLSTQGLLVDANARMILTRALDVTIGR